MNTLTARPDIAAFAAAVRAQLDDLPADDTDDLLEGLEADLTDQADEAGEDFALPDPAAYAAELRAAAGLPVRRPRSVRRTITASIADGGRRAVASVRGNRFGAWLIDTLVALRPVWWLARAFVLAMLLAPMIDTYGSTGVDLLDRVRALTINIWGVLLFGSLLLLSVQWGRGSWAPVRWLRVVRRIVNVVATLAAPFILLGLLSAGQYAISSSYANQQQFDPYVPGLSLDGQRVRNIFAYDAQGEPIMQVQLFDQNGTPLTTVGQSGSQDEWDYYFYGGGGPSPVAETAIGRLPVWNVFPLREAAGSWDALEDPTDAQRPVFPFAAVPSLPASAATLGASDTSAVTDAATAAPTP